MLRVEQEPGRTLWCPRIWGLRGGWRKAAWVFAYLVQPRLPCASTCRLSRAQMSAGGSLQAPLMLSSPAPGLTSCSLDSALDHIPHSHLRGGLLSRQAALSNEALAARPDEQRLLN